MKKIILPIAAMLLILSNYINVNAAHQHSENCYVLQEHVHTGNESSGGGCYGAVNYHVHSGDSVNGGGCYGAVSSHVHSGDATSGGGCYGTANYHVHSGDATSGGGCYGAPVYHVHVGQAGQATANGCYTALSTDSTATCTVTVTHTSTNLDGPDMLCSFCNKTCNTYVYAFSKIHSSCGQEKQWHPYTHTNCQMCGTLLATNSYQPGPTTHSYSIVVYDLGCGKTEQFVEYYELSCGKTSVTVENYSISCGKTADTVEGYVLNCGKTTETIENYSLSCEYQDNATIKTVICTLGGNEYAMLEENGLGKKARRACYEERVFMVGRCKQAGCWQLLCSKGM